MAAKDTAQQQKAPKKQSPAMALAMLFHETYEGMAPEFGYTTNKATRKFNPNSPNGKLMVAVAQKVLDSGKLPYTLKQFEKEFYGLDLEHFMHYTTEWNEKKLKLKIKKQADYDGWLNYFKTLSPNAIKLLAISGQDILDTEAYTALRRWYDIISNPHRIEKIHQAGLTNSNKKTKSITELATQNDRLGVLMATRDAIAEKLQKGAGARDTAALARELTEIMTQIADYEKRMGPKKDTVLGKLLEDMPGIKTKRPGKNGGGARNTSFKSRVTIKDIEDNE